MKQWYSNVKSNWLELFSDKRFFIKYVVNSALCYGLYMWLVQFLIWNSHRPGVILDDPIQHLFEPYDFSVPTFILTYACIILYVLYLISRPRDFYYGGRAFLAVFVLRASFIYLVPLVPPTRMIYLTDPFLDFIVGRKNDIINDLFFSGHIADVCIFIFCCRSLALRCFMIASACAVALMLVWQHVHYTADVVASPFFAYVCYIVFAKGRMMGDSVS